MARRRQRRRREKELRHAPRSVTPLAAADGDVGGPVERLVYSREQAAQALGVSLATLERRVVPAIATVKTEWGARLIPAAELERYLAERTQEPRAPRWRRARSGRRARSEEHTSELQSRGHLVGRLLLAKKKLVKCDTLIISKCT